jgi:hypothetical protein
MRFPLSDDALRRLLNDQPIGDVAPFDRRPPLDPSDPAYVLWESASDAFIERVIDDLVSLPDFTVDREEPWPWSSYKALHWTLSRRRGMEASAVVWLCRFAPVAVYCAGRGVYQQLAYELPDNELSSKLHAHLTEVFEFHQVALVPKAELNRPLPFDAYVDTNLGSAPFTVFDALFRWSD